MDQCSKHDVLVEIVNDVRNSQAKIETDLKWLIDDRKEQKEKYEKKKNFVRNIHYGCVVALASAIGILFENRESVRLFIKEWLGR